MQGLRLLQVDGDAGGDSQQVLVVAGQVGQAGVPVVRLNHVEGEMLPVLQIDADPRQQCQRIGGGLNESRLVGESGIKAVGESHQGLGEGFDAVIGIRSVFALVSKPEIEAHSRGHHEQRKRLTGFQYLTGVRRGYIHHGCVSAIGTKISLSADAVHEKAPALTGPGVRLRRTIGQRNLRTRQREISS